LQHFTVHPHLKTSSSSIAEKARVTYLLSPSRVSARCVAMCR